jgi:hypothetical protein
MALIATNHEKLKDFRCMECSSLIGKVNLVVGKIEIKCRCGCLNVAEAGGKIKTEGSNSRERIQTELLNHGFSIKAASKFIEKFNLCEGQ